MQEGDLPKELIHHVSEQMLDSFAPTPLVDKYEAYQRLMTYWAETMQDDVFIIAGDGWAAARKLREARKEVDGNKTKWLEEADLTINKVRLVSDVIPPTLVVVRFFPEMQATLEVAQSLAEDLGREIAELVEEHGTEGGLLVDALTDTGKLTSASVKARDKTGNVDAEEAPVLKRGAKLLADEAAAKKAAKEAQATLDEAVLKKYPELTEAEIRMLVAEDKWLADMAAAIGAEVEARTESLTARVRVLTERYGHTLPDLIAEVDTLEAKVAEHLAAMGF